MFVHCASQAAEFLAAQRRQPRHLARGTGRRCSWWACTTGCATVRLREAEGAVLTQLFYEMMEKQWEQVQLDLSRRSPAASRKG